MRLTILVSALIIFTGLSGDIKPVVIDSLILMTKVTAVYAFIFDVYYLVINTLR